MKGQRFFGKGVQSSAFSNARNRKLYKAVFAFKSPEMGIIAHLLRNLI